MYFSYQLYEAGRVKSPREQREADARIGEQAKSVARLWHALLPARHQVPVCEPAADDAIRPSCLTAR